MRHQSILALFSILPMLFNLKTEDPMLSRGTVLAIMIIAISHPKYGFFTSSINDTTNPFTTNISRPIFTKLADTMYRYNNSETNKIPYRLFSIVNILLLSKVFIM